MKNDLISREALKKELEKIFFYDNDDMNRIVQIIDNAPTALFPLTVQIIDKVTDENIEALKQLMKDYKPQILRLEDKRPQGDLVQKLNERIEKRVCKYCQMNKHCELCEISRVFSIIALTNEEMKGGAE